METTANKGKEKGTMAKVHRIGNRQYIIGKSKASGFYAIWELKTRKWAKIFTCSEFADLKKQITHLQHLAAKRELRETIADICGTSYAAARRDMGI